MRNSRKEIEKQNRDTYVLCGGDLTRHVICEEHKGRAMEGRYMLLCE